MKGNFACSSQLVLNFPNVILDAGRPTIINSVRFHLHQGADELLIKGFLYHTYIRLIFHIVVSQHHVELIYVSMGTLPRSCLRFRWYRSLMMLSR